MKNRKLFFIVATLCLLTWASLGAFGWVEGSTHSAVGTWKLDPARSSAGNMPLPKFEQLVITTDDPNAMKWSVKVVSADGKSSIESYDGPTDGKDHPMMSSNGASTIAYNRTSDGVQWVMKDRTGATIEAASGELSADGKTLTIKGELHVPKGTVNFVSVYNRVQ
jgi:hypothetical protein